MEKIEEKNEESKTDQNNSKKLNQVDSKDSKKSEKKKQEVTVQTVSFSSLFRYSTGGQKILIVIAMICSSLHGAMFPFFTIILGRITGEFTPDKSPQERRDLASRSSFIMAGLGLVVYFLSGTGMGLWKYIGDHTEEIVKNLYFQKIVQQEIGWFDVENPEKLTTKYTEEMVSFRKGTGESCHMLFFATAMSVSGIILGFFYGWKYSLFILLTIPVMFVGMGVFVAVQQKSSVVTKESYAEAGAISEQVFQSISTVYSLNGQKHEIKNYISALIPARKSVEKYGMLAGICFGIFFFAIFCEYGFGFWIGSRLIAIDSYNSNAGRPYNTGDIVSIFFSVVTGAFSLGQIGPAVQNIGKAREAAFHIYKIIERKPEILINEEGKKQVNFSNFGSFFSGIFLIC